MSKPYLQLRHEQDQDEANALLWWESASEADKRLVWAAISRFAQIGFTHVALMARLGNHRLRVERPPRRPPATRRRAGVVRLGPRRSQRQNVHHTRDAGRLVGRGWGGKDNPKRKLSDDQVRMIRRMKGIVSLKKLASMCGVSKTAVLRVQQRVNHGDIPDCPEVQEMPEAKP